MRTKEINDLESQAKSLKMRAAELYERAHNLRYLDRLEELGLVDKEVVEYEGDRVMVNALEGHSVGWLSGLRIKKDGEISNQRRTIYYPDKIKRLPGGTP